MTTADFRFLAEFLRRRSGLALGPDKGYLVTSRLAPVARAHGLANVSELVRRLATDAEPALGDRVVDAMTTNESFFFRDGRPFELFAEEMLPALMRARQHTRRLSIWCAAAATGQEPYSLAMCLQDRAAELAGWRAEILATDISRTALDRARTGRYSEFEIQRGLPAKRRLESFTSNGDGWVVRPEVRRWVRFAPHNLLTVTPSFGRFDVVFCRYVLIYFDPATKRRVVDAIAPLVAPDGYLVLGGTETVLGVSDRFTGVAGQRGIFRPAEAAAAGTANGALVG